MLDLEKFGVAEMSYQETQEVEGGFWLELLLFAVGFLIGYELIKP